MPFRAGEVNAIEDKGGLVPEGRYVATVTAGIETVKNGVEQWELTMTTTAGHTIKDNLTWSEKAMLRGKLACLALGIDLESDPEAVIGAANLVGRQCEVEIEHHEGEGRDGKKRMFHGVPFRGYHALTAAQQQQAAQASEQGKAAVRSLFDKPAG